jgi:Undecaprenyl-phosphate glucose phosphotransferase
VRRQIHDAILFVRILCDMAMVSLGWIVSYFIRFSGAIPVPRGIPEFEMYAKLLPFIWIIWLLAFYGGGFYRRTGRHRSAFIEALDIVQSSLMATALFIAFTYVYEEYRYSRGMLFIFAALHPWLIITGRSLIRKSLRRRRRLNQLRRILLIGEGENLQKAVGLIDDDDLRFNVIEAVFLIEKTETFPKDQLYCKEKNLKIYPIPTDMTAFLSQHRIDVAILALSHRNYWFLDKYLDRIADQVPEIKIVPDLLRFTRFAADIEVIEGTPMILINESPMVGIRALFKRLIDIFGALLALVILGPLMGLIALLVKSTSEGPIFYRQERMGLDGKTFEMLKFRSINIHAEKTTGAVWATAHDHRTTPLGKWLRRTSLDELPQFLNVLRGEMSLVGPRPERPIFVEQFRTKVPGYYLRHKTKAGITGWAQVNGWRGNTSIEKRIECDLYYIQNWSLRFDIKILILTIFKGFVNKNAY